MYAQPRPHAARTAAPLLGLRGRDPRVVERGHAPRGVVPLLLLPAGVNDQADVGERDRGLRHVGREYHLDQAARRQLEDPPLLVWRQAAVQRLHPHGVTQAV